ncbi:MAG: hypothetical protein M0C28_23920 [Candidatus Moduliflexus flocculans]|nr:hypothetical protein [Candidatus Moduliflexus flocculans]
MDTAGNQLPYIDRIVMSLAENLEVLNLRAIAGEYDLQERHISLSKLPVFIENQKKGNYTVHLDTAAERGGRRAAGQYRLRGRSRDRQVAQEPGLPPGAVHGHRPRPAQRGLLAGDRDRRLVPRRPTTSPSAPARSIGRSGPVLDLKQANELLDKIGLTKKDGEGYRLRTDGKGGSASS